MAVVAGDTLEITYNNPNKGSGRFFAKAGEDSEFVLGGYEVDDDKNAIDGGGRNIKKMNMTKPSFSVLVSWDMNTDNEMQKLQDLCDEPLDSDFTISHINGSTWAMTGSPVGENKGNGNSGTFTLKISGGGRLKKILG